MTDKLIVNRVCKKLYEDIQNTKIIGHIHSVFDSSINIITNENSRLISLLTSYKPMAPYSIQLKDKIIFSNMKFKQGQEVVFYNGYAIFKEIDIKIYLKNSELWDKSPLLFQSTNLARGSLDNVFKKLEIMREFLLREGKKEGILPLLKLLEGRIGSTNVFAEVNLPISKREEFIKERFLKFIDSYIEENIENISYSAKEIIGFGIGLTPSMDDFISGLMLSRIYIASYLNLDLDYAFKINKSVIKYLNNKTTLVSEEMIKYASVGEANEDLKALMISLLSNCSIYEFYNSIRKVSDFGATSGTDLISGIYVGSCIMFNNYRR